MKEGGPWRIWTIYLLLAAGNIYSPIVNCQSYSEGGARGDVGADAPLGFDGVLARHDGYVKGETPTIPQTSFSCSAQPHNPGLYADVETQCQVYHVCFEDRQESFLCGPGTNFNQRILACDFWYNFDCQNSPSFYNVNADIGKTPDAVFNVGQGREPQQPSYPNFPRRPEQPPSGGSYPSRVTVPPPPPPRVQTPPPVTATAEYQPPQPQPPRIQPEQPIFRPDPPRPQPRPEPPRFQPQPRPEPPRFQPQPRPEPPRFQPQPQPEPPRIDVQPQYPPQRPSVGQGGRVTPQRPSIQQEEDSGYHFEGNNPQQPEYLPPPPPPRPQTPRPVFPPVVSPPRVSRPPLTPAVIRQPESSISRPRVPTSDVRPDFHPDSNLKGNIDYVPPQQPRPQPPRQQQPRVPQPSRPVGTGYPSYPVSQRPISPRPEPQRPIDRPYQLPPTLQQEHIDTEYVPPRPKEPSRPSTSFVPPPPPPRPIQQEVTVVQPPSRPYVPPPPPPPPRPIQQEVQPPSRPYVPPPPPRPIQQEVTAVQPPSRPYVPPPPPRPIQQEVTHVQPPSRPYVPPPPPPRPIQQEVTHVQPPLPPQRPIDPDYGRPQPPVAPSIIREQQKPAVVPPSRPQVSEGGRQSRPPQRPKPVFPPPSDHPNANIKGGPGYQQPPPQIPRFEPTRIGRPSAPQGVRPKPDVSVNAVRPTGERRPSATGSGGYKVPQQERVKKPSEPPKAIYQPPIQVVDHPRSEIKGTGYESIASQQPQRIKSPSASSGVKRPQPERPRAPVVVSRPQPPSLPATNIKTVNRVDNQISERPQAVGAGRVKTPSPSQVQPVSRPSCSGGSGGQGCPRPIDHPNASIKGGSYPVNQERRQPSGSVRRPSVGRGAGGCSSPSGGCGRPAQQEIIRQPNYEPQRRPQASTGVKTKQPSISQQSVVAKQPKPEYGDGSSYTRGPDVYPKPGFGQPNAPYQPVSTPSRASHTVKTASPSQNTITQADNKPDHQRPSVATGSGGAVRPGYPSRQVPGHQPPNQPQVFPHRENPDHPNESLKGSGAYRPPPPAGFQGAASEVQSQQVVPAPEPEPEPSHLLGDIGAE